MYKKFSKHVLCEQNLKKYEKSKDLRIKQYFDIDNQYQNFDELNKFHDLTPFNLEKKVITPTIRKFIETSKYRYPKCILKLYKNYSKSLPSTSDQHVGVRSLVHDSKDKYYKLMLEHMTGLPKNNIIRRVVSAGLEEHRKIVTELKKYKNTPKALKSFKNFEEVKLFVKETLQRIVTTFKNDFPNLEESHKKLPRIHVHRSKPGEPKAYYVIPVVSCKYTRGDPKQRGKVVIQLTSLNNVDIGDLTLILVHEVLPGHFYEFHNYPNEFYVSPYWFNEGWGLYVEKWIDQFGDSYKKARLIERLLRATRCIIDPYIHTKNRSLTDCVNKMYTLLCGHMTRRFCKEEVLRYICNPGQACSYLIGCKFIERMCKKRGDLTLKQFHNKLLSIGPSPMKFVKKKLVTHK